MKLLKKLHRRIVKPDIWARPKMQITFRAELMPGKNRQERTFKVEKVLSNGRVILQDFVGEHRESEFEPVRFDR